MAADDNREVRGLATRDALFRIVAESASDAIVTIDRRSTVLFANAAAEKLFGYSQAELVGHSLTMLMPEFLRHLHEAAIDRYLETGEKRLHWGSVELPGLHKSGRELQLEVSFGESIEAGEHLFTGVVRDVSERKRQERRWEAQHAISQKLAASGGLEDAVRGALEAVCRCLDWKVGVMWQPDTGEDLRVSVVWQDHDLRAEEFLATTWEARLRRGVGLPGRVWDSREPHWIQDVQQDNNFPRHGLAQNAGLHAAFAIPVLADDEFFGVMEFFSPEIREPDTLLLKMLQVTAAQVGQFLRRKQAEEALREQESHFRLALESAETGTWELDVGTGEEVWSDELFRLYGLEPQVVDPTFEFWLSLLHPDDRERVQADTNAVVRDGRSEWRDEFRIIHPQLGIRWMLSRGRVLRDKGTTRMTGTVSDITEQKLVEEKLHALNTHLEARVGERTQQLESSSKELESFVYAVSHDLRAPLRGIDGFSRVVLEDYGEALPEPARKYLLRVSGAAGRMGELIDGLLDLSRISRAGLKKQEVDLSAMANEVVEDLRQREPGRQVEFLVSQGVTAEGDPRLLRIVLENLFENAWKFTRDEESPRIEFTTSVTSGQRAFVVRDNGAGFDMQYAEKLFGAFQRLHSPAEFEGSGIGLATVQRIVHRHGGSVWAEAVVGEGSTFYFTLGSAAASGPRAANRKL